MVHWARERYRPPRAPALAEATSGSSQQAPPAPPRRQQQVRNMVTPPPCATAPSRPAVPAAQVDSDSDSDVQLLETRPESWPPPSPEPVTHRLMPPPQSIPHFFPPPPSPSPPLASSTTSAPPDKFILAESRFRDARASAESKASAAGFLTTYFRVATAEIPADDIVYQRADRITYDETLPRELRQAANLFAVEYFKHF